MTKYSTGGSTGGGDGDACELCGEATSNLREASVAGAELLVCSSCAPHDDSSDDRSREASTSSGAAGGGGSGGTDGGPTLPESSELWDSDTSRWEEEGTGYESDQLPYLVADYGKKVTEARQDAGFQRDELAAELDADEDDLLAVEQGRAARAGVGGTLIAKLEDALDIELADE